MHEGKDAIRAIDQALADGDDVDQFDRQISSLAELSKKKSMYVRDEEARKEEMEEEKQLINQAQDIKQHFIDVKTGKQYDPDKRFGLIEDGTQLIYDNITTAYEVNLPPSYYLKYVQDAMPNKDDKKWFIRPHHVESLTNHYSSLKDDVLNTRYFSHYNRETEEELS